MTAKLLFRKTEKLYAGLLVSLDKIETANTTGDIGLYEKSLMDIDLAIRQLKAWVNRYTFASVAEEVYFFREIKPKFVSLFIYYAKVLATEAAKPNAGQYALKEYYEYELRDLKRFTDEQQDFYEYYRRKATYLDEKYFVRKQFDFKIHIDSNLYNYDQDFATSHDHLIAQIMANDRLEKYFLTAIYSIEGYFYDKFSDKSPLTWSGSKSSLIELLYALHVTQSFNGGNIDFSETVRFIEKSFNTELGNFYKTLHEIRNRKTGNTKFLAGLAESLKQHFERGEEA